MQSFVNQPFLTKRAKFARWGSYVGLGALFIGLVVTSRSPLLAYVFLLIGLLAATFGSYMANMYVREPRADQVLSRELDGLDKRYTLYSYYLASNHIIASHYGLTVVLPKPQEGEVSYVNGRWRHKAGWRKIFQIFGEPGLGKPDQELNGEIRAVKEWIDKLMPEQNIPVNGVILFTNPRVKLNTSGLPAPAVTRDGIAEYMKQGLKGQPTLTTSTQTELRRILDEVVAST